ncbi:GNAT family N-acetyltransferase [Planctomyces sp. SH-PL62]|uniref:GNAT family N-acetyltransferase n=1 Tax=Planctomyces sp. SH-PL62 TaxID=1636152 RepID=UPI00078E44C7|nr:GNAT family N-acetyltransferase [Planctomyces sp. SH-PL62]AMV40743.1 Mycothiol acetyltransferase [Planctomyces sp. SH-PL62]
MASSNLQILRCPPDDRAEALDVLYQGLEGWARSALVAQAMEDGLAGRVDLSGLWIARRGGWTGSGRIVGVLLSQTLPGRAAAVWAPRIATAWGRAEIAAELVRGALDGLRESGVAVAQAVLDGSGDSKGGRDLARGGMPRITDLVYLRRDAATPAPVALRPSPELEWRGLDDVGEAAFLDALAATYAGSLDMPELEGARPMEDVVAGHRGAEGFDPTRWRLGRDADDPEARAVVLLADAPDRDAWEVVYLGLTPRARGRGFGVQAVTHALALARPHALAVELAVDVRNHPAARLYRETGFVPFDRRAVHLAVLSRVNGGPAARLP